MNGSKQAVGSVISVGGAEVKERLRQQAEALMLCLEYQPVRERMLINAQAVLGSGSTQRSAPNDSGCRSA